jgi:hypothetical protein
MQHMVHGSAQIASPALSSPEIMEHVLQSCSNAVGAERI